MQHTDNCHLNITKPRMHTEEICGEKSYLPGLQSSDEALENIASCESSKKDSCIYEQCEENLKETKTELYAVNNETRIDSSDDCSVLSLNSKLSTACLSGLQSLTITNPSEFWMKSSPGITIRSPGIHNTNISFTYCSDKSMGHNSAETSIQITFPDKQSCENTDRSACLNYKFTADCQKCPANTECGHNSSFLPVASPVRIRKLSGSETLSQKGDKSPVHIYSFMSYRPICRICHEDDDKEILLSPCRCSGSIAKVHKTCLERWLSTTPAEGKCELCGYRFTLVLKPKSFREYLSQTDDPELRKVVMSDAICLSILTPLIVVTIYLCIMGAVLVIQSAENTSWEDTQRPSHKVHLNYGDNSTTIHVSRLFFDRSEFYSGSVDTRLVRTKRFTGYESSGLICLAVVLLAIYLTWAVVCIRYHQKSWKSWRLKNQDISLADTNNPSI